MLYSLRLKNLNSFEFSVNVISLGLSKFKKYFCFLNKTPLLRHMQAEKSQKRLENFNFFKYVGFNILIIILLKFLFFSCSHHEKVKNDQSKQYITVLGIAQDAGFPHINYSDEWTQYKEGHTKELVVSLGLIDKELNKKWLFEATPDMPEQLFDLENDHLKNDNIIDGVFLTHAHMGHYTGLMHFGREAMGANNVPVYAMPKMKVFLENNGPWSQLVSLKNIELRPLSKDSTFILNKNYKVTPFIVPHRDEYSETVGYKIEGPHKSALFIPDINKWSLWERNIVDEIKAVDYAFLDATFFKDGEIPRPMSEVPHPFIEETMSLLMDEEMDVRSKVIFIHFNHSNPAILESHRLKDSVSDLGFRFARRGDRFPL